MFIFVASLSWYHYLLIAIGAIIIIHFIIFLWMYLASKKAKNKINNKLSNLYLNIIDCCGGKDNILDVNNIGSRLTLSLKDVSKIDEDKLKEININGIFKTSKKITLVIGELASEFANKIKQELSL